MHARNDRSDFRFCNSSCYIFKKIALPKAVLIES